MTYLVLQRGGSLQVSTDNLVVRAEDVQAFDSLFECARSLTGLLEGEKQRIQDAVNEGRERGLAEGQRNGEATVQAAFAKAVAQLAEDHVAQQTAARDAVCGLALAVVRKLSVSLGAQQVVPALLEQAVAMVMPERSVRISVHPSAVGAVEAHVSHMELDAEVSSDDSLDLFGCVLEDTQSRNLVGLDDQLTIVAKALDVAPTHEFAAAA
jgi:flagellar biosynthesis/type III secretory pathway protein FliH